jgi:hypothetical protein
MSDNLWDCEYFNRCKNNDNCLMCGPEQRLLKLPEDKSRQKYRAKAKQNTVTVMDDNTGSTLEDYVAANFNNLPTVKEWEARRQAGSGNIWFMPGDVADSVILAECKERSTTNSKGEKSISIPKAMIEKIAEEAKTYNTYPALIYRYKGDESGRTYFIQEFEVLCDMVHEIKILRHENKIVKNERDMYKQVSEQLHQEVQRLKRKAGEE